MATPHGWFWRANHIGDDAELNRRRLACSPPVQIWDKMQGFFARIGGISDSNPAERRESPIETQNELPMCRIPLVTVT